jgi:hypothetical protein
MERVCDDPQRCYEVAETIRQVLPSAQEGETVAEPTGDEIEEPKRAGLSRQMHRRYERNPALVHAKKRRALAKLGKLACEACGFDFQERYGERGEGFIECHHVKPVHALKPGDRTRVGGPASPVLQLPPGGPCEAALVDHGAAGDELACGASRSGMKHARGRRTQPAVNSR